MDVEVADRQVTWRHHGAKMAQTLTITARDDDTLISHGRMSLNGGPWGDDLSQVFRRER